VSGTKNHTRLLKIDFDCISRFVIYIPPAVAVCLFIQMVFVTSQYNGHCGAQKKYRKPVTYDLRRQISHYPLVHLKLERGKHKEPFSVRVTQCARAFFGPKLITLASYDPMRLSLSLSLQNAPVVAQ